MRSRIPKLPCHLYPPTRTVQTRIPLHLPRTSNITTPVSRISQSRLLHSSSFRPFPQDRPSDKPKASSNNQPPSSNSNPPSIEGATDLSHAHFISSASPSSDFNPSQTPQAGQGQDLASPDLNLSSTSAPPNGTTSNSLGEWQGKLSPTSSHLFKLLIPLPSSTNPTSPRQTAFLLHPSQPLSHLSRLIIGSLSKGYVNSEITYLSVTGEAKDIDSHLRNAAAELEEDDQDSTSSASGMEERQEGGPYLNQRESDGDKFQEVSWSQSTDLSDFIKQSCLNEQFKIVISPENNGTDQVLKEKRNDNGNKELTLEVIIPSFASRTHYIRRRLLRLTKELDRMTKQKKDIDYKAHKGAQRLAVAALGGGVVYWAAVIRWTFFTDAGWDLMEPVTWATGFAALLGSAAFLIYHNREVSYSSLLDLSITARQRKLYDQAGLDIDKWTEMVSEAKTLRREITRIASDYDIEWKGELENLNGSEKATKRIRDKRGQAITHAPSSSSSPQDHQSEGSKEGQEEEGLEEEKIDIDKTIQEASDLAEQSEEKRSKEQSAQRKGKVIESPDDKAPKDRGTNARAGGERRSDSEVQGEKKAREVIDG
ncbi:hypothetical protein I302_105655 [Kwoniella bestiolae CBS 10118]|uniref:Calcium uniporter protein, mitochondrial n=1 Tax=Kwoniella bestiolae CBS 10118 TaxID=1296100 RepID=A0A1B9G1R0_9TREE|nr:hypothetical protein I302_04772 [Kwoniella bestiolae CBS 10118]OCF24962.1 hypothetical protein I302_04772 [Kwoniella bestiolae CBS 10118]